MEVVTEVVTGFVIIKISSEKRGIQNEYKNIL